MKKSLILFLILISGCSSWPEEGQGGWAEKYHPEYEEENKINEEYIYYVKNEYEHLEIKISLLKSRGVEDCMPAQIYEANLLLNRIEREISATMYYEAKLDLIILYHEIKKIENHFNKIIQQTDCGMLENQKEMKSDIINKKIENLLNNNNQFAFNNVKITPKYKTNISLAADLLKTNHETKLILIGHADNLGYELSNYELAYKRAENVKKWLILYGVREQQIITSTKSNLDPYSAEKNSAEKRHSDRRVEAHILLKDSKKEIKNKIKKLSEWTNDLNLEEEIL